VASQQIGRELGVRYVVEGSVRSSDNRVGGSEAFERMVF
jgi:TolB-like protein